MLGVFSDDLTLHRKKDTFILVITSFKCENATLFHLKQAPNMNIKDVMTARNVSP